MMLFTRVLMYLFVNIPWCIVRTYKCLWYKLNRVGELFPGPRRLAPIGFLLMLFYLGLWLFSGERVFHPLNNCNYWISYPRYVIAEDEFRIRYHSKAVENYPINVIVHMKSDEWLEPITNPSIGNLHGNAMFAVKRLSSNPYEPIKHLFVPISCTVTLEFRPAKSNSTSSSDSHSIEVTILYLPKAWVDLGRRILPWISLSLFSIGILAFALPPELIKTMILRLYK